VRGFDSSAHTFLVRHYERRLPHWDSVGQPVFATFRLLGSLPESRVFPKDNLSAGEQFEAMDRLLDRARTGPRYLAEAAVARVVVQAIRHGADELKRYDLHAFVVMPNHVHLLVTPHVANARWLGPLKGFTGAGANRILHRKGPFWQDESYDHLVRSAEEFRKIVGYIEHNPVAAGLVNVAEEYPWSSAAGG
jgi:putative transposase